MSVWSRLTGSAREAILASDQRVHTVSFQSLTVYATTTLLVFGAAGFIHWPMDRYWPVILTLQFIAIGLPACRLGRRGAWIGAVLATFALGVGHLAQLLMARRVGMIWPDLQAHVIAAAVLAFLLGETGEAVTRRLASVLGTRDEALEAHEMVRRAAATDKLATVGRLVAGAAHEINNPLAVALVHADLLADDETLSLEAREATDIVRREIRRAGRIVRDLLAFARQRPTQRTAVSLETVVRGAVDLRKEYAQTGGVEIFLQVKEHPMVYADANQIKQVLLNLLVNAQDAVRQTSGHRIALTLSERDGSAVVTVDDSGPGVPPALREKIFEPFFTTKPEGQGTGLGLSVSFGIVVEHGGKLSVETSPLGGARFIVRLPVHAAAPDGGAVAAATHVPRSAAPRRVLIVDDELALISAVARFLERFGHTVRTAGSGADALEVARRERFDVIISDLRMPNVSGPELYGALAAEGRLERTRFVVATGDVADAEASEFVHSHGLPVLLKPFDLAEVAEAVAEAPRSL